MVAQAVNIYSQKCFATNFQHVSVTLKIFEILLRACQPSTFQFSPRSHDVRETFNLHSPKSFICLPLVNIKRKFLAAVDNFGPLNLTASSSAGCRASLFSEKIIFSPKLDTHRANRLLMEFFPHFRQLIAAVP